MKLNKKNSVVDKPKQKKYNIELGFVSKVVETKDMKLLKDLDIKSSFLTGENKRVFVYIQNTFRETGEVPTSRVLEQKFPSYELETYYKDGEVVVGTEETLQYWCKELRTKAKHNKMADAVENIAEMLSDGETEKAYDEYKKNLWQIENEIVESDSVDTTKDLDDRKKAYLERKMNQGMMGIPMGIPHLDYIMKGLIDGTLTTVIAMTGVGKAVTLNTPILTPQGFVPMRDIKVGSVVFDEKGRECNVTKVFPQGKKQVYRVHFEDGTYVDCCKDHLWKFKTIDDIRRHNDWRVETTEQLLQRPIKRGRSFNLSIPVCEAIDFPQKDLPLNPYVLGCLLGDGGFTTDRISFTNPEKDILDRINFELKDYGSFKYNSCTNCQYLFKSNTNGYNHLYRTIKQLGLIGHNSLNKFIPSEYLISSKEQRLELLRGLIDTDGHVDKKGHVSYFTSSEQLKDDVMGLIRSLGFRCSSSHYERCGKHNIEYVVRIWSDESIFFTSNKHKTNYSNRVIPNRKNYYDVMKIVDIEILSKEEEMQCITVNSNYHTFICGDYIVTHNTWFVTLVACYAQLQGYRVLFFLTEMSAEIMRDRCEAMLYGMTHGAFDYNKFKAGAFNPKEEQDYFDFLDNTMPSFEPMILETATGVSSVVAVAEREKPDLICIDGAYLMEDEQGAKEDWARITHITRDLKKVSKRLKKPILINTQADQKTTKKTGPGLSDIKYSQAIAQDSDNVLALFRDEVMIADNEMGIRVQKQREGTLGKVVINWNFKTMDFSSIYSETDSTPQEDFEDIEDNDAIIGME